MLHPDLFALTRNLLELAADAFARNSSNDYTLPDLDPEAREQLAALVTAGRGSDEEPDTAEAFGPEAIVSDWQIMLALARGLAQVRDDIEDHARLAGRLASPGAAEQYRKRVLGLLAKATGGAPLDFADGVAAVGEIILESAADRAATIAKIGADTRTTIVNEITAEAKRIADEEGLDARVNALMAMARKVASGPTV